MCSDFDKKILQMHSLQFCNAHCSWCSFIAKADVMLTELLSCKVTNLHRVLNSVVDKGNQQYRYVQSYIISALCFVKFKPHWKNTSVKVMTHLYFPAYEYSVWLVFFLKFYKVWVETFVKQALADTNQSEIHHTAFTVDPNTSFNQNLSSTGLFCVCFFNCRMEHFWADGIIATQ